MANVSVHTQLILAQCLLLDSMVHVNAVYYIDPESNFMPKWLFILILGPPYSKSDQCTLLRECLLILSKLDGCTRLYILYVSYRRQTFIFLLGNIHD